MLSTVVSRDLVNYMLVQKSFSQKELAEALGTTVKRIRLILCKKESINREELNTLFKLSDMKFWELATSAIPSKHLSESVLKKIKICQEISDHLKKNRRK